MEGQKDAQHESSIRDASAFRSLYEENLPKIYGYFLNRCGGDSSVAEDLTQETFLAAVKEIQRGPSIAHPSAWIRGIARHKLVDFYRSKARNRLRLVELDPEHEDTIDDVEWDPETGHDRAVGALAMVHETQRAALVLRYVDGLSVPDVAEKLEKSIGATESLLSRGKEAFRRAYLEAPDE